MPTRPFIDFAVIQQRFDGANFDGKIAPCRITILGESPNAEVRACVWVKPSWVNPLNAREPMAKEEGGIWWPGDFVDVDHLVGASIDDEGGKILRITGTSDMLRDHVGIAEDDNRSVEWTVEVRGCQGCS